MCLAIPAKIVELFPDDQQNRALVEVVGVRRHIDTGLLQDDAAQDRRLGSGSCRLCDEQDQRRTGAGSAANAGDAG